MDEYDLSDSITIKISKAKDCVGFSHWEVDVISDNVDVEMAGTSPTFWGVLNMATDYLWDTADENDWFKDDANAKK